MSIRATFHYFQGMECDMYSFYRIPKLLFTSEYFKNLSCEAKVLYGLMLDRMSLSIKNRWFDEEDRAYIFFSVEEIMEMLNCGRNKAVNCLKELDQEKGIGLIEKRRIGLGKTNVIYVKNFSLTEYPDEPAIFDSEETPENVAERKENTETEIEEYAKKEPEKPVNTQKFEKQTSGSLKNKLQEVSKTNFKEFEKQTSRSLENKLQEVSKTNCNRKVAVLMKEYLQSMKSNIRKIIRYIDDTTLEKSNDKKKDKQESASTISEEVQEFVNLTITEHMGKAYSEWKLKQDKEPVSEIDKKYQKLLETLSQEQEEVITEYCNAIFSSGAETEEFFYRLGLKDGLNLKNTVKSVLEMIS